jgi:ankyrin repeat protein
MKTLAAEILRAFQAEDTRTLESLLLSQLPSLNILFDGLSPLSMAVMLENRSLVFNLLEAGADPNFKNEDKSTALTHSREFEMTELLLQHGASTRFEIESELETSLHIACGRDDFSSVKTLIEKGEGSSCSEVLDEFGRPPLAVAVQHGSLAVVEFLLHHGFPVNYTDSCGGALTPLQLAIKFKRSDIARVLVSAGADVNLSYGLSQTPLEMARDDSLLLELLG